MLTAGAATGLAVGGVVLLVVAAFAGINKRERRERKEREEGRKREGRGKEEREGRGERETKR